MPRDKAMSPLIQLVLTLCSPNPTEPQDSRHIINPKQIAKQQNYKRQYTMAEYLTIVSEPKIRKTLIKYRLSEHSLAIETVTGRHGCPERRGCALSAHREK